MGRFDNFAYANGGIDYVPLPKDQVNPYFAKALEMKQETYSKNKSALEKIREGIDQIKRLPGDEQLATQLIQQHTNGLEKLVDTYKDNYSSADFTYDIGKYINKVAADQSLNLIQNRYNQYGKVQEEYLKNPKEKYNYSLGYENLPGLVMDKSGKVIKTDKYDFGLWENPNIIPDIQNSLKAANDQEREIEYYDNNGNIAKSKVKGITYQGKDLDNFVNTKIAEDIATNTGINNKFKIMSHQYGQDGALKILNRQYKDNIIRQTSNTFNESEMNKINMRASAKQKEDGQYINDVLLNNSLQDATVIQDEFLVPSVQTRLYKNARIISKPNEASNISGFTGDDYKTSGGTASLKGDGRTPTTLYGAKVLSSELLPIDSKGNPLLIDKELGDNLKFVPNPKGGVDIVDALTGGSLQNIPNWKKLGKEILRKENPNSSESSITKMLDYPLMDNRLKNLLEGQGYTSKYLDTNPYEVISKRVGSISNIPVKAFEKIEGMDAAKDGNLKTIYRDVKHPGQSFMDFGDNYTGHNNNEEVDKKYNSLGNDANRINYLRSRGINVSNVNSSDLKSLFNQAEKELYKFQQINDYNQSLPKTVQERKQRAVDLNEE